MKRIGFIILLAAMIALTGCVATQPRVQKSQLQIRSYQTKTYDTKNYKMIMKAVMHTLQDDGFIIKQANIDLGLLTAQQEIDITNQGEAFFLTLLAGSDARYKKNSVIEFSANISEFGNKTRVRVNVQIKALNNKGEVMVVKQDDNPKNYQDFFSKLDKAVFLGKEKLQ